jgi:hypothetical protein
MADFDGALASKSAIPDGWTQERKNGRAVWRCPKRHRAVLGGWCRCSVTYPRHRITTDHKHRFVQITEAIDPVPARPARSIPDEVLRHLSILAARLNISARAATSEPMTEFITAVIATTLAYVDAHPDHAHEPSQIFRPVSDKTLTGDLLSAADQAVLEKISRLRSAPITIQMDAGTILRHHFLNYVVSCPGFKPFLVHSEFHDTFSQVDYSVITTRVIEDLLEKGVTIAGVVADNLFCQQAGLRLMTASSQDPRIKGLIILPCVNHILNLVLRNSIDELEEFAAHIRTIQVFQGIMRKNAVIRQYGKVCPTFPETRWMYVCGLLNWILAESDELMPFILQCIEDRNEIGELLRETEFCEGIPAWVQPLQQSLHILEELSLQFESRKASLWMVVPLLEVGKIKLLANRVKGISQFDWIRDLVIDLARRLIARFRTTFNAPAATAAYFLSNEGRMKCRESPGISGLPYAFPEKETFLNSYISAHAALELAPNEYWRPAGDVGIERTLSDEDLLRPVSFMESSSLEPVDEESDVPRELAVSDEEEIDPLISGPATSRTQYRRELARLLEKDAFDLVDERIFQNCYLTTENFLNELAEKLELLGTVDVKVKLFNWISGHEVSWYTHIGDPPEIMWAIAATDERWTTFATLAQRVVGITPSEAEVERVISIQRDLVGTHGTRFSQDVFRSRTQLRQG